jgi:hypothetical protein
MHLFQRSLEIRELISAKDLNPGIMLPVRSAKSENGPQRSVC